MKKEKYPWLRLKGETSLSYKFFTEYLNLGEKRSLEKVRKKMDKRKSYIRQLENWSTQYSWVERARFYDDHIANRRCMLTYAEGRLLSEVDNALDILFGIMMMDTNEVKQNLSHKLKAVEIVLNKAGVVEPDGGSRNLNNLDEQTFIQQAYIDIKDQN